MLSPNALDAAATRQQLDTAEKMAAESSQVAQKEQRQ